MKAVQYFSKDYLEQCRTMRPEQVVRFVEGFRELHSARAGAKSRLISMRVPETLLEAFKTKARLSGIPYQAQIKRLMEGWLDASISR